MTQSEEITQLAKALVEFKSMQWLMAATGISYYNLKVKLESNKWLIDEATIIRKYHELFIEKPQEAGL